MRQRHFSQSKSRIEKRSFIQLIVSCRPDRWPTSFCSGEQPLSTVQHRSRLAPRDARPAINPSPAVPHYSPLPLAEREDYTAAMRGPLKSRVQVFDPRQEIDVVERRLPHWSQAGTIAFLTWRAWDSIPSDVLEQWLKERDAWLKQHGIVVVTLRETRASRGARGLRPHPDWRAQLQQLSAALRREFHTLISNRWNECLDACHGECLLRQPANAKIVADSLLHFDGDRYDLTDFVVMPNHVHVLAAFPDEESMLPQCDGWKHFTAAEINRATGCRGRFWQQSRAYANTSPIIPAAQTCAPENTPIFVNLCSHLAPQS
jgi:putative transposase